MEATSVFEIRNNLIGVPWKFDDAEKDYMQEVYVINLILLWKIN